MKYISFAIPCYNSQDYMAHAIESILPGGEDIEIIIVNDGSKDRTSEIAHEYMEKYPTIVKVVDKENGGHGDAVNSGLTHATGKYFKVVDSDDWVDEDALHKILDVLRHMEEDGMELAGVCLTHGHFDHVMALPYLMEQKPDLDIYLYEDEADVLADPQLNLGEMMGMDLSLKANHLVKDGEIIDILGTKVKCIHVPGHTKGGVCYYFADYGWLISGDTLFQMSIGRTDFPTGNLNDLLTAIREKLFVLPPWTKVLSGHTPPTTIEEESRCNPFLQ